MAEQEGGTKFQVGNRVKILNSAFGTAEVVELRGPFGPQGAQVYRLRVRKKPRPAYIEVLEEQMELVPEG